MVVALQGLAAFSHSESLAQLQMVCFAMALWAEFWDVTQRSLIWGALGTGL